MVKLRNYLKNFLPYYMIPSQIIRIAEIPSNRNGKLDTNRLMKKLDQFNACRTNIEYASTETENNIQSFLINLLKLDSKKIDMNKNFFELGGDSLLAISLTSFVEENFHVTISAKEIFDADTIKYICKIIDDRTSFNIESSSILPIPKTQLNCLPMSSAQRRIYYACKLIGNNNLVYNAPGAILIDALLDKKKVEQAFKKINFTKPAELHKNLCVACAVRFFVRQVKAAGNPSGLARIFTQHGGKAASRQRAEAWALPPKIHSTTIISVSALRSESS